MTGFIPSRDPGDAERTLATLVRPRLDLSSFKSRIQFMQRLFSACIASCPPPWPSPDLQITPEINYRSEQWLPLDQLSSHFNALYRQALTYPPVLLSTPFAQETSWAAVVAGLPTFLGQHRNPAAILEQLVGDYELRMRFLFWSFMPDRFYGGGSNRYPGQSSTITEWLRRRHGRGTRLRCLDAASGDGATTYGVARVLVEQGWSPGSFEVEGWTLDPLEAWAAAHGTFPHDQLREAAFRKWVAPVFQVAANSAMLFKTVDLMTMPDKKLLSENDKFDLIVCNGLLGGPIISRLEDMRRIVSGLCAVLAPGGMLLAADHFHGGWKKNIPGEVLGDAFKVNGLFVAEAGEGLSGTSPAT